MPLHYSPALLSEEDTAASEYFYNLLVDAGADEGAEDSKGNTASYYLDHPEELDLTSTSYSSHDSLMTGSTDNSFKRQHRASIFLKNGKLAFPSLDSPSSTCT